MPHEWFAFLYAKFKPIFFKLFACAKDAAHAKRRLREFWGMAKHDDPIRSSLQADHEWMHAFTFPGWIHGDGVPCTKYDSFEVCSWGSMLSKWIWFASGYFLKVRNVVARADKTKGHQACVHQDHHMELQGADAGQVARHGLGWHALPSWLFR